MSEKLYIFDTTLRDGEQAPGASLNPAEKLEVAHALAELGVDIIEAGFPISSHGDLESVEHIARQVKGPVICALARCVRADIDAAAMAVKPAKRARIHLFLATSKIHMQYKLKKAEDEILRLAVEAVQYAKKFCDDVEFTPEDASRTDRQFLKTVVEAVIDAGATAVNIPDTVGFAYPGEFGDLIAYLKSHVPNIERAVLSVHCHNDLGMGVANSLAAIKNGARQVECTVNGIGERAGNASLEEIVMAIATRRDIFADVETGIRTQQLYKTSRLVSKLTGFVVPPNKAIVGSNAFRHESGIHQDGVLKERSTYEIIRAEDVGATGSGIVLGKHSGRHALAGRLEELGFKVSESELDVIAVRFKELADKKKNIFDGDLISIVENQTKLVKPVWALVGFEINSGTAITPTATVTLKHRQKKLSAYSSGDGPVDACFKAIDKITGVKGELQDYRIEAVTKGKDALGEVALKLKVKGRVVAARGTDTDIIAASVRAYVNALNKIESL